MDFLLLYHFRKLKDVAIEISQELLDNITPSMIFEIFAIKNLSDIEKYLVKATLVSVDELIALNKCTAQFVKFLDPT